MCATKTKHVFVLFVIAVGNKTYINEKHVDKKKSEETYNVGIKDDLALDAQHTLYASFFF